MRFGNRCHINFVCVAREEYIMESSRGKKGLIMGRIFTLMTRSFYVVKVQIKVHSRSQKAGLELQFLDLF